MFEDFHETVEDSQPVNLYQFTIGGTVIRHTSAEKTISVSGIDYTPFPGIAHSKVSNSGEAAKNKVTISVTRDFQIATWLLAYIPTTDIFVTIYSYERADTDDQLIHEFSGIYLRYISRYPSFKLEFAPLDYDSNKQVMRYSFAPICQHTQYDDFCTLDQNLFVTSGLITAVNGETISTDQTLTGVSADHFVGGYIEVSGEFGQERAWITAQSGANDVLVDRGLPAVAIGVAIKLFPSCRGEFDRCKDPALFNNKTRFFGAVHANKVNPFDSTGVKASV